MIISEGRYYKTRDGRKVGPMLLYAGGHHVTGEPLMAAELEGQVRLWCLDGSHIFGETGIDLIAEWPSEGPVRTRTVTEIVPGVYAGFHIGANDAGKVHVVQGDKEMFSAPELRAAATVLTQLADALETK